MITLITPTKPENHAELKNCLATVTAHANGPFEWLLITERENVYAIQSIAAQAVNTDKSDIQVISMACLQDEIEDVKTGYNRQRLAKLLGHREATHEKLLFLDDDVQANDTWKESDFFTPDGAPIIYFNRTKTHAWRFGTAEAFGSERVDKQFQIALPFAYTVKLAKMLAKSGTMGRAWVSYRKGPSAFSDFELMGQFAFNSAMGQFRNIATIKTHWTLHRELFTDWQGRRRELRENLGIGVA